MRISPERIRQAQAGVRGTESVGQQRMMALHGVTEAGSRSRRTCGPATGWYAAARARRWSAATREVADRIEEYHALGIDHFILSGQPHLEEAYYFAEGAAASSAGGLI